MFRARAGSHRGLPYRRLVGRRGANGMRVVERDAVLARANLIAATD